MEQVVRAIGVGDKECISICGCGGKTTLLWGLAKLYRAQKILVAPTAKIGRHKTELYDSFTSAEDLDGYLSGGDAPAAALGAVYGNGVHLLGSPAADGFHLNSAPLSLLEKAAPYFDKVLMEGDGSRTLPLKGWAEYEPVIPAFTTLSIGVITLWPVGLPLSGEYVHRMEIFCKTSGAVPGELISLEHVAASIVHPGSMFRNMIGRRVLLINQVESRESRELALDFIKLLPGAFLQSIERVVCTSLQQGQGEVLYRS